MKDHSENTLRAAIKSLRDTVAPALDPTDDQAQEQLRLTVEFLEFLRTRLYDLHPRHRYELGHQIEVAESLDEVVSDQRLGPAGLLAAAIERARGTYNDPASHTRELESSSEELWGTVRAVVRHVQAESPALRQRVAATVLTGVAPLVEMESAWYLPYGFEPDPTAITDLDTLLAHNR